MTTRALALALLSLAACQSGGESPPRVDKQAVRDAAAAVKPGPIDASEGSAVELPPKPDETEPPPDPGKVLDELGAIPAWQAVVDRTLYLARRSQHGVVYGTIVPADPLPWLVDETDGNGALAIHIALAGKTATGRVALAGAWTVDADRNWLWNVDTVTPLAPATTPPPKDPPSAPGHAIATGSLAGARPISLAKDGDLAYFQIVGPPPAVDGDGWPVADQAGNPVYALLNLPGERPSFGGQDMRTADERWQLKRGVTYALRIGHVHKHGAKTGEPDRPATINARTAPLRIL